VDGGHEKPVPACAEAEGGGGELEIREGQYGVCEGDRISGGSMGDDECRCVSRDEVDARFPRFTNAPAGSSEGPPSSVMLRRKSMVIPAISLTLAGESTAIHLTGWALCPVGA